jgi:DNA-binding CsgD family transcriptional regulator
VRAAPFRAAEVRAGLDAFVDDLPSILVLLQAPRRSTGSVASALRTLGLTPAEARVAETIASGRSPEEAAADLGIALSTVRHHLKRTHEKLDVRRQSELVRVVNDIARFVGPGG